MMKMLCSGVTTTLLFELSYAYASCAAQKEPPKTPPKPAAQKRGSVRVEMPSLLGCGRRR
jgi:hypothetical protein